MPGQPSGLLLRLLLPANLRGLSSEQRLAAATRCGTLRIPAVLLHAMPAATLRRREGTARQPVRTYATCVGWLRSVSSLRTLRSRRESAAPWILKLYPGVLRMMVRIYAWLSPLLLRFLDQLRKVLFVFYGER